MVNNTFINEAPWTMFVSNRADGPALVVNNRLLGKSRYLAARPRGNARQCARKSVGVDPGQLATRAGLQRRRRRDGQDCRPTDTRPAVQPARGHRSAPALRAPLDAGSREWVGATYIRPSSPRKRRSGAPGSINHNTLNHLDSGAPDRHLRGNDDIDQFTLK